MSKLKFVKLNVQRFRFNINFIYFYVCKCVREKERGQRGYRGLVCVH